MSLPMFLVRLLAFLPACIYDLITTLRNWLFDLGIRPQVHPGVRTWAVGNLAVGGTGKTPHVEWIVRLLGDRRLAILSRGYGRRTRGFRLAGPEETAATIGDEPMQYHARLGARVPVAVGEKRVPAASQLLSAFPATELLLLDDAFQHRHISPDLSLLLTEYDRPFFKDWVMPMGRLREARRGARRAHAVIVTKCPQDLGSSRRRLYTRLIHRYTAPGIPVWFSFVRYGKPVPIGCMDKVPDKLLAVSGIARPAPFVRQIEAYHTCMGTLTFGDHHDYTPKDLEKAEARRVQVGAAGIMITEKDAVKWRSPELMALTAAMPVFYLPIEIHFGEEEEEVRTWLLRQV